MPPSEPPVRAQRRTSGARVEASERVTLRAASDTVSPASAQTDPFETQGWTLNVGRGGVRVVVEERLREGGRYELIFSDDTTRRQVEVAWLQDAADGQIAGLKYLDADFVPSGRSEDSRGSSEPPATAR